MTTIDHSPYAAYALRPSLAVRIVDRVIGTWRAFINRRAIHQLGEMTDTELADIGLRRADLHLAFRSPLGVDPTETLGIIASARSREAIVRQVG